MTAPTFSLHEGMQAPAFSLILNDGQTVSLEDFKGKQLLIYFYPRDDTPGCTVEACDFRDHLATFKANNITVIGVSKDNADSHKRFCEKHELTFDLGVDPEMKTLKAYGVWGERIKYADDGRSPGSLAIRLRMSASSSTLNSGDRSLGGVTSALICWAITVITGPVNGCKPVAHS